MKLYVGNLPWSVDDEKLKELFSAFNVEEAAVIIDKFSKRSKGFGFVTVADENGEKAISEMNDKELEGRQLKVSEAKPMREDGERSSGFKESPRQDDGDSGSNDQVSEDAVEED